MSKRQTVIALTALGISTATNIFLTKVLRDVDKQRDRLVDALQWEIKSRREDEMKQEIIRILKEARETNATAEDIAEAIDQSRIAERKEVAAEILSKMGLPEFGRSELLDYLDSLLTTDTKEEDV